MELYDGNKSAPEIGWVGKPGSPKDFTAILSQGAVVQIKPFVPYSFLRQPPAKATVVQVGGPGRVVLEIEFQLVEGVSYMELIIAGEEPIVMAIVDVNKKLWKSEWLVTLKVYP